MTKTSGSTLLPHVADQFTSKPFIPPRVLTQGDLQTLIAYLWPGRFRLPDQTGDEGRLFKVEPGSQVLARCRWQTDRTEHATLLMWHGMEGSTGSAYMLAMAHKAFRAGLNVVRMNVRNCGGTEHLTPTLYHAGLTGDLRAVIDDLTNRDRLTKFVVAGFSLGGNMALKLAGEYGSDPPPELKAVCAVSPSIDLRASVNLMAQRRNWLYQQNFLARLKERIRTKARLFPELYDATDLRWIRSVEQFDNRYVAPGFGFADASDYYARASALPFISRIRIPTLIIHAQDDPFIPFAPLRDESIAANPNVLLLAPEYGGHVAFLSAESRHEDRFWAENRVIEFCQRISN